MGLVKVTQVGCYTAVCSSISAHHVEAVTLIPASMLRLIPPSYVCVMYTLCLESCPGVADSPDEAQGAPLRWRRSRHCDRGWRGPWLSTSSHYAHPSLDITWRPSSMQHPCSAISVGGARRAEKWAAQTEGTIDAFLPLCSASFHLPTCV